MNNNQERIQGLPPSIDNYSAVLILGTLPGHMSLTHGKYYADPLNKFWDILFIACGEEIDKSDQAKEALQMKYNIALWDILDSAVRGTSSDKDLMDEKPNDLPQLLEEYPNIKLLLFHSKSAYKYFKRFFKNTAIPYICVSSPSGQNRKGTEEKAEEWRAALSCVLPQLHGKSRLAWKSSQFHDIMVVYQEKEQLHNMGDNLLGFEKIYGYISYFETLDTENACQWQKGERLKDGSCTFGYPVYEDKFLQFIEDVSHSDLMDISYGETLQKYGLEMNNGLSEQIETADLPLAKAILTCYVRQERFCEGLWGTAIKNGVFLALLNRLQILLAEP